jgi:hypothetical protein
LQISQVSHQPRNKKDNESSASFDCFYDYSIARFKFVGFAVLHHFFYIPTGNSFYQSMLLSHSPPPKPKASKVHRPPQIMTHMAFDVGGMAHLGKEASI